MFSLVEQQEHSELTIHAFCTEHNLKVHSFRYWRQKYRQAASRKGFIPIIPTTIGRHPIQLSYPNGVSLHLDNVDINLIAQLIRLA